jgi:hypothetical protein
MDSLENIRQLKRRVFKYRLKKQYRKKFRNILVFILLIFLVSFVYSPISNFIKSKAKPTSQGVIKVDRYKDYNKVHLYHAKKNGITPFRTNKKLHDEIDDLLDRRKLVHIKPNKYYEVKRLTHSYPYLTPGAAKFLDDLGKRFRKKLKENNMGKYSYQLTSLLRTGETQKNLSRSNVNATSETSHLYGTTFDISYKTVIKKPLPWMQVEVSDAKAIKLLSEAIGELKKERRCVVVTERLEKCFHITAVY